MFYNNSNGFAANYTSDLLESLHNFKKDVCKLLGKHCDLVTNALKFHLPDHILNGVERFETVQVLSASPHEHLFSFERMILEYIETLTNKKERCRQCLGYTFQETEGPFFIISKTSCSIFQRKQGLVCSVDQINLFSLMTFEATGKIIMYTGCA